ncbi:hypothetical protein Pyrfu_0523 [Pyrolobus fumarii 1A]|uniref:Uncharacterized protein n=1 Tax=Pyrolobus fumarii (strain DSM 11204 / 1A) TaxID=694429 RepID=G0EGM0_PYRF1|nr:hypothetical protein [Pyrolobus fumarii]AEM38394.1 hypothetical protein Pyrfu_0523 [Pyrolobus fumarii 1A]
MQRAEKIPWRRIVDWVFREYRWELDILREYDRSGRLPSREEVERLKSRARRVAATR